MIAYKRTPEAHANLQKRGKNLHGFSRITKNAKILSLAEKRGFLENGKTLCGLIARDLSHSAASIAYAIFDLSRQYGGHVTCGMQWIAKQAGVCLRTVRRHLPILEKKGWLFRRSLGEGECYSYVFTVPAHYLPKDGPKPYQPREVSPSEYSYSTNQYSADKQKRFSFSPDPGQPCTHIENNNLQPKEKKKMTKERVTKEPTHGKVVDSVKTTGSGEFTFPDTSEPVAPTQKSEESPQETASDNESPIVGLHSPHQMAKALADYAKRKPPKRVVRLINERPNAVVPEKGKSGSIELSERFKTDYEVNSCPGYQRQPNKNTFQYRYGRSPSSSYSSDKNNFTVKEGIHKLSSEYFCIYVSKGIALDEEDFHCQLKFDVKKLAHRLQQKQKMSEKDSFLNAYNTVKHMVEAGRFEKPFGYQDRQQQYAQAAMLAYRDEKKKSEQKRDQRGTKPAQVLSFYHSK